MFPSFPYASLTSLTIFERLHHCSWGSIAKPDSFKISLPRSTFVPSKRTTNGKVNSTSLTSLRYLQITSHFMIPPKMFTKIPLTLSSPKMILNASVTFSFVAPPLRLGS